MKSALGGLSVLKLSTACTTLRYAMTAEASKSAALNRNANNDSATESVASAMTETTARLTYRRDLDTGPV